MKINLLLRVACIVGLGITAACGLGTEGEEIFEGVVLSTVNTFELADSSKADSIMVRLAGTIGQTTAYSFGRIDIARTDTLFVIAVIGKWRESSNEEYTPSVTPYDTILILQTPKSGLHFVEVLALNGPLRDSSIVY